MKLNFARSAQNKTQPDPYILRAGDGNLYIYASDREGVLVYRAPELDGVWEYLGICFREEGFHEYWAPCVVYENGLYYMYYSSCRNDCEDMHEQALKVAVSSRPDGGFVYHNTMLTPFSIDAHVVKSGDSYYVFYSTNDYEALRAGTYIAVDKMTDMFTAEGNPVPVVRPTLDEEIFMRNRFRPGQDWHTIEGAFYFREGDRHFVMYSGNCYQSKNYFVGYAYAYGKEDDLRKLKFEKVPSGHTYSPFLCQNAEEMSTGHNSVLHENGKYFMVYHARDPGADEVAETRTARYRPFEVNKNELKLL